jgi:hypothetical protein
MEYIYFPNTYRHAIATYRSTISTYRSTIAWQSLYNRDLSLDKCGSIVALNKAKYGNL